MKETPHNLIAEKSAISAPPVALDRLVLRRGWRRLRVKADQEIWFGTTRYYPEIRPWWWPFWFRSDDGSGCQVSFATEEQAWRQIEIWYPPNVKVHTPIPATASNETEVKL